MVNRRYITALTFATITLVISGWAPSPIGNLAGTQHTSLGEILQFSDDPKPKGIETQFVFRSPVYKPRRGVSDSNKEMREEILGQESVTLFALVPNHLGLTIDPQPTLYWYLSKPAPYPLNLTVHDGKGTKPILKARLGTHAKAGIHSVPLKAFDISLEMHTEYNWLVSLAVEAQGQTKSMVAGGTIKRIEPSNELKNKLKYAIHDHITAIYSEEGLWYDALASISNLCEKSPKDNHYCLGRKDLLEQIDLSLDIMEIAQAEEGIIVPNVPPTE